MKSTRAYIFDKNNLRYAIHKSYIHKSSRQRAKKEVCNVMDALEDFIDTKNEEITSGTYHVGAYRHFDLIEEKTRHISVLPYEDRCVQNLIKDAIEPILVNQVTNDMCAGLPHRGIMARQKSHSVIAKMRKILSDVDHTHYVVQLDISKCYPSIKNAIVIKLIEKCITDKVTLALIRQHIFNQKELAIGDPFSHLLCNLVISQLIRYLKENLKVKHVIDYADDVLIFASTKDEAKSYLRLAKSFLATKLRLHLNKSSQVRNVDREPIHFCGRIYYRDRVLLCQRTKKNYIKKRHNNKSMSSYNGCLQSCDSKHLRYVVEKLNNKNMRKRRTPFAGKSKKVDELIGIKHTIVRKEKRESSQKNSDFYFDVQAIAEKIGLIRYTTGSKLLCDVLNDEDEEIPMRDMRILKDWRGLYYEGTVFSEDEEAEMFRNEFKIDY